VGAPSHCPEVAVRVEDIAAVPDTVGGFVNGLGVGVRVGVGVGVGVGVTTAVTAIELAAQRRSTVVPRVAVTSTVRWLALSADVMV
jgi:hypothetical protein